MDDVEYPPESTSPMQAKTEEWTEERMSRRDKYEISYRVTVNCPPRHGDMRYLTEWRLTVRPDMVIWDILQSDSLLSAQTWRYEISYRVPRQCAYVAHRHYVKAELQYRPNTTNRLAKMDGYSMQAGKQLGLFWSGERVQACRQARAHVRSSVLCYVKHAPFQSRSLEVLKALLLKRYQSQRKFYHQVLSSCLNKNLQLIDLGKKYSLYIVGIGIVSQMLVVSCIFGW